MHEKLKESISFDAKRKGDDLDIAKGQLKDSYEEKDFIERNLKEKFGENPKRDIRPLLFKEKEQEEEYLKLKRNQGKVNKRIAELHGKIWAIENNKEN